MMTVVSLYETDVKTGVNVNMARLERAGKIKAELSQAMPVAIIRIRKDWA